MEQKIKEVNVRLSGFAALMGLGYNSEIDYCRLSSIRVTFKLPNQFHRSFNIFTYKSIDKQCDGIIDTVTQVLGNKSLIGNKPDTDFAIKRYEYFKIERVIFNPPATIVFWQDGTKTVVKAQDEDFDPEKGLAMAISKKALGNRYEYYNVFEEWLPEERHVSARDLIPVGELIAKGFAEGIKRYRELTIPPINLDKFNINNYHPLLPTNDNDSEVFFDDMVERNCSTCAHEGIYTDGMPPCMLCDSYYHKQWTPKKEVINDQENI